LVLFHIDGTLTHYEASDTAIRGISPHNLNN